MSQTPKFSFYISPLDTPISPASAVWQESLPLVRPTSGKSTEFVVSHGEYFDAVRSFFEQDGCEMFCGVSAQRLQQKISVDDIQQIRIHLEKHGEFYHPARIETDVVGHTIFFVLNVAVSDPGQKHIYREFHNIQRLNAEFADPFLPKVYTMGEVNSAGTRRFWMFLAEWFKDYHEFHLSRETSGNQHKICVWDDRNGRYYLSGAQASRLYKQAASIMTYYYDVETFEHISPWHHAAGDFVVRPDSEELDLKLITVRGYAPLFQVSNHLVSAAGSAEQILQALLIFFLKLSIRMRLDRVDGVGEIVWSAPGVVRSTVEGVLDGLAQKPAVPILPDTVGTSFKYYLSICRREELFELTESILQTFHPAAPEIPLIRQHLGEHVRLLAQALKEI
jgi:hypothetical protein